MIVEKFSKYVIRSRILKLYVAAAFFATLIFFVLNADMFTPIEMIFYIILATITFKGLSNLMLSMIIALIPLSNEEDAIEFEKSSTKLESLVNDLAIKEAAVQSSKNKEG